MLHVKMLSTYHIAGTATQSRGGGCTKEHSGSLHAKMRITSFSTCTHKHKGYIINPYIKGTMKLSLKLLTLDVSQGKIFGAP